MNTLFRSTKRNEPHDQLNFSSKRHTHNYKPFKSDPNSKSNPIVNFNRQNVTFEPRPMSLFKISVICRCSYYLSTETCLDDAGSTSTCCVAWWAVSVYGLMALCSPSLAYKQRDAQTRTKMLCTHLQGAELPEGKSCGVGQNHLAVVRVFSQVGEGCRHVQ